MTTYYVIARKDLSPTEPHSSQWPKILGYSFENKLFYMSEGRGHGLMGGELPEADVVGGKWSDIVKELNANWFIKVVVNGVESEEKFLKIIQEHVGFLDTFEYG